MHPRLRVVEGRFAVCRLAPDEPVPAWAAAGAWWSVTRTADELSVVCDETCLPPDGAPRSEGPFAALAVEGPLDFALTGVLAGLLAPLRDAAVSVFVVSTFDTDYVLVPAARVDDAVRALRAAGYDCS